MITIDKKYNDRLDKVDKYIMKFATDVEFSAVSKSRYYKVCGKIIRVSDHIGNTSDGVYHIIVKPNGYLIHHPNTGTVNIVTYEQVKEFIRVFQLFPVQLGPISDKLTTNERLVSDEENMTNLEKADYILGVHKNQFSSGQLQGIRVMVDKVVRQRGK